MSPVDSLEVHLDLGGHTVPVGHAQFHRGRGRLSATTFQYETTYLAHPRAYAIDPALELVSGTQHTQGLPGAFADSAPDRWGRNLITKRERSLARNESRRQRTLDDVDFLVGVSDLTRQGALRFREDDSSKFLSPTRTIPKLIRLPTLLHAAEVAAQEGSDDFEAIKTLLAAGTGSLGGARPKAAVLGEGNRQLIAKFPHHGDEWNVMAWEATALELACAAGVNIPPRRLVEVEGRLVLLVERFDRSYITPQKNNPSSHRLGYLSAMTLLGGKDGDSADYVDIADHLPEISSQATKDLHQLFRRVAVSVGLNNTDDHLRNHGFLRDRAGWRLSPAFDINPDPAPTPRQTTIGGANSSREEPEGIMELADACRLKEHAARGILNEVSESISQWRQVATTNGATRAELTIFEEAFAAGLDTLGSA